MRRVRPTGNPSMARLLDGFSLEMTGKDIAGLNEARASIPVGTRINVTFLGQESPAMRLEAARKVGQYGFIPVPHIAARRLRSVEMLEEFLAGLREVGAIDNVFVVGGDPTQPEGPFEDSLSVITSGILQSAGVRNIGICGYPEGHPDIADDALWSALDEKVDLLSLQHTPGMVVTQFGFDVDPVVDWIEAVRARGVDLPIRIGLPGPAGVRRLLSYASRFGVSTSAGIAKKYGFSITNLLGTTGPERFVRELAERYDAVGHGDVKLHFYTFGGLTATSEWIARFRTEY